MDKVTECAHYVTLTSPPIADDLMNLQKLLEQRNKIVWFGCKMHNFDAQYAQINRALFQNVNEKKILASKLS